MFLIFNIILIILYYIFYLIKYISTNLFGLNLMIVDFCLYFILNKLNDFKMDLKKIDNIKFLKFKNLYIEYFFYFDKNMNLKNYLINNTINTLLIQDYNLNLNLLIFLKKKKIKNLIFFKKNLNYIINNININKFYKVFNKPFLKSNYVFNLVKLNLVYVSKSLTNLNYFIKYNPSNFIKYIKNSNVNNYMILFLRKNKVFNKGRYSRNRQYYRTGVYWCLYINIVAVVGIYFWFYKIVMNFGYLWWLLYLFIVSCIFSKVIKYRLYNLKILFNNFILNFIWLYNILLNFNLMVFKNLFQNLFNIVSINILSNIFVVILYYIIFIFRLLFFFFKNDKHSQNIFFYKIINLNKN